MTFSDRLNWCMRHGNLTVSDLSRWFDRPYPTVRVWVNGGNLGGAPMDAAAVTDKLARLEKRIKDRNGFPVPRLTPTERVAYILETRG